MVDLITENRERVAELCRTHHVQRLAVFGSAANGADFNYDRSDIDLIVEFEPLSELQYSRNYFSLLTALEKLLGRQVDLVSRRAIRNPHFQRAVEESQVYLYAA